MRAKSTQWIVGLLLSAASAGPALALSPQGEGRRVFLKLNCYGCHGMAGAGGMGPNIVGAEVGDVSEKVLQGSDAGMPSYATRASAVDIANLAAYLQSIGTASEPKFTHWWEPNPTK